MTTAQTTETELRHAVIDRLIAASLRDVSPARDADLKSWRTIGATKTSPSTNQSP
jgi:hypothetical protein